MGSARDVSPDFIRQLAGYGLTTAEILYHMPDEPTRLQTYLWQAYDLAPTFPALTTFLCFWRDTLDGAIRSVRVGHAALMRPAEVALVGSTLSLH